jgi:hypothetical protein
MAPRTPDELPGASEPKKGQTTEPPQHLFTIGFYSALIIAVLCLVMGAFYLYTFMQSANSGIEKLLESVSSTVPSETPTTGAPKNAGPRGLPAGYIEVLINGRLVMARLALLSCGVSVGFAFGFLGFALFLLGIKGSINANVQSGNYKASFARLSPGLVLLLASIILIGICVTHQTPFEYAMTETEEGTNKKVIPSTPTPTPEKENKNSESTKEQLPPKVE